MTDRDSRWEGKERQLKENNQHFWIEESVLRDWPKQETNVMRNRENYDCKKELVEIKFREIGEE